MTIAQDLKAAAKPRYIELYTLDLTPLGGSVFYFTPHTVSGVNSVSFGGQVYTALPIIGSGWETSIDGAPPQPVLSVSNVYQFLQSYVSQYHDLVGARVTRTLTFDKYLDASCMPRWNVLSQSEAFDNASWAKARSTVTANATTSPFGATTAEKLTEDTTASNSHYLDQRPSGILTGATNAICWSAYLKAGERTKVAMQNYSDPTTSQNIFTVFDLSAGTVIGRSNSAGTTRIDDGIQDFGNGWYRCWQSVYFSTSDNKAYARISIADPAYSSGVHTSYTGDGSSGLYLFGAQLEQAAAPSAYQYTTTTHQPYADSTQIFGQSTYVIEQKVRQNKLQIDFKLASIVDAPMFKLPRGQVLRKDFPGAGLYRKQ